MPPPKPPRNNFCRLAQAQSLNVDARRVSAVASTEEIDSYGTVLASSGWDLSRFQANPVLLFAHDGNNRTPVGHCENVRVEGAELLFDAVFDDTTAFDIEVWTKYAKGIMRGFSVRFDPIEHKTESRGGRDVMVFTKQILMEISCAPVPSNAGALARTDSNAEGQRTVNRLELMAALRALSEGEGEEAEKKAAGKLYEAMGGAKGELACQDASREGAGEEKPKEPERQEEEPPPSSKKPEEQRTAGNVEILKRLAELEKANTRAALEKIIAENEGMFTDATRAWAMGQSLETVRTFVAKAPKLNQRAAAAGAPTRGDGQGESKPKPPEISAADTAKLDKILGTTSGASGFGFEKTPTGTVMFRTATADQIRTIQEKKRANRKAI